MLIDRLTLRVHSPLTEASTATATIACSAGRSASRNDGGCAQPGPLLWNQQLDLPDGGGLSLHQLTHEARDRAPHRLSQAAIRRLGDTSNRHALVYGHRDGSLVVQLQVELTSLSTSGSEPVRPSSSCYTTFTAMTLASAPGHTERIQRRRKTAGPTGGPSWPVAYDLLADRAFRLA